MTIIINLDPILRQIVSAKNKKFVRELQGEGMREKRIGQILGSDYYKNIYSYPIFPRDKILECKKNCFSLSYSMKKINALLDDENILDAIKNPLLKELNRLCDLYFDQKWIATIDSVKKYSGPGNPKTWKQMIGFQIYLLYEYIKPFTKFSESRNRSRDLDYRSKDVFELIAELVNIHYCFMPIISWKKIKTTYEKAKRHKGSFPE
jgi:hypothetical protein